MKKNIPETEIGELYFKKWESLYMQHLKYITTIKDIGILF
jgi:hypothetical protein